MQNHTTDLLKEDLYNQFILQKNYFKKEGIETIEERKLNLFKLKELINENLEEIIDAINADYGTRSRHETILAEIVTANDDIKNSIKKLKKWTKVQKRHVDHLLYLGAKNYVIPQPLGVIGIIVPWNFPINLMFSQLSAVFAAGNMAMVKMSENSRNLAKLLIKLVPNYFKQEKLIILDETGNIGIYFSQIPFDHLIFTGSSATGRKVMTAAAQNLTPVTLELGGKSPAVIDPEYPIQKAVERIMFVKQLNAGQICTNVDYLFLHESKVTQFIDHSLTWVQEHVPNIHSESYTSIIDDKSFKRLVDCLEDAKDKGAQIITLNQQEPDPISRKFPLTLVLKSNDTMDIDTRETFGPILMIKTYQNPNEVVDYIVNRDRPLAFR
ncbi:aldehyde dehydrogenase family protein, partial [Acinetobacter sp. Ver3]|uniref:aldehyde dehydrogenase family protein n=1 Tax=Acinetobacter sp. Ver3 TaxID=466088 RepID=UPI0004455DD2